MVIYCRLTLAQYAKVPVSWCMYNHLSIKGLAPHNCMSLRGTVNPLDLSYMSQSWLHQTGHSRGYLAVDCISSTIICSHLVLELAARGHKWCPSISCKMSFCVVKACQERTMSAEMRLSWDPQNATIGKSKAAFPVHSCTLQD